MKRQKAQVTLWKDGSVSLLHESRSPSSALSHRFFFGEGSPTRIDYREKGTLILTSLLKDLGFIARIFEASNTDAMHLGQGKPTAAQ